MLKGLTKDQARARLARDAVLINKLASESDEVPAGFEREYWGKRTFRRARYHHAAGMAPRFQSGIRLEIAQE